MLKTSIYTLIIFTVFVNSVLMISLRSTKSLMDLGKSSEQELAKNDNIDSDIDLVGAVNNFRELKGLKLLKQNADLAAQAKEVVDHIISKPQEFDKNFNFAQRSQQIPNKYYTEDQCKLLYKSDAANKCVDLMIIDPDVEADLLRDHDEAGSHCGLYGNGYICSI